MNRSDLKEGSRVRFNHWISNERMEGTLSKIFEPDKWDGDRISVRFILDNGFECMPYLTTLSEVFINNEWVKIVD